MSETRYAVDWCETGHEDYHTVYFTDLGLASDYGMKLVQEGKTYHGACGITEQVRESLNEADDSPIFSWQDIKTWECDGKAYYDI